MAAAAAAGNNDAEQAVISLAILSITSLHAVAQIFGKAYQCVGHDLGSVSDIVDALDRAIGDVDKSISEVANAIEHSFIAYPVKIFNAKIRNLADSYTGYLGHIYNYCTKYR